MHPKIEQTAERRAFYEKIGADNLSALWNVLGDLITREPKSACRAAQWRFETIREHMLEAGDLITAQEAERRVLVLENPGLRGQSRITTSIYAGVQLITPGETAPAHRHSQSALRFVLEGRGAFTAVGGERAIMAPGDFIITPSMAWHDHGNPTADPVFWLDGLDIPIVQFFDASFAEGMGSAPRAVSRATGDSFARYGHNLAPVNHRPGSQTSPLFAYPYLHARESLEALKRQAEWDPCQGIKLRYLNPLTGSYAMSTIGTFIQLLPKGFATLRYRSTDATVFVPIEGRGRTRVGNESFEWRAKDVIVAPSWQWVSHEVDDESVLFSYSDRPIQEKLDLFREERADG